MNSYTYLVTIQVNFQNILFNIKMLKITPDDLRTNS